MARMLAFAQKVKQAIEAGEYEDQADAARQLGLTRTRVSQLMDLAWLSPRIQENISHMERVDDHYDRFPWYASRSEIRPKEFESEADPAVYTVGYEGRTIDGLLDHLLRSGIRRLIDVRKNAMSRKYGFSGKTIKRLCANVDIEYVHVPSLGIPSSLREDLTSPEAYQRLFDRYERDIIPGVTTNIADVAELCAEKPSALMCFEATSDMCHRGRLASYVAKESSLEVKHL